jgi:hypothetical protein
VIRREKGGLHTPSSFTNGPGAKRALLLLFLVVGLLMISRVAAYASHPPECAYELGGGIEAHPAPCDIPKVVSGTVTVTGSVETSGTMNVTPTVLSVTPTVLEVTPNPLPVTSTFDGGCGGSTNTACATYLSDVDMPHYMTAMEMGAGLLVFMTGIYLVRSFRVRKTRL